MFRSFVTLFAFSVSATLSAKQDLPQYARTAADVATAIYAGDDISQQEGMFELSELEKSELKRLSGCDGVIQPTNERKVVVIDWKCGEGTTAPGLTRSTAMIFDQNGVLYGFGISGLISEFEATEIAKNDPNPPSTYRMARSFADAVVAGDDPTLGGYIPMTDFDLARLAKLKGWSVNVGRRSVDRTRRMTFTNKDQRQSGKVRVFIHYNENSRPIGLIFQPSYDQDWIGDRSRDLDAWTRDVRGKNKQYR